MFNFVETRKNTSHNIDIKYSYLYSVSGKLHKNYLKVRRGQEYRPGKDIQKRTKFRIANKETQNPQKFSPRFLGARKNA